MKHYPIPKFVSKFVRPFLFGEIRNIRAFWDSPETNHAEPAFPEGTFR